MLGDPKKTAPHPRAALLLLTLLALSPLPARSGDPWWSRIDDAALPPAETPVEQVIDRYIGARLADRNIPPAPEAPRHTLLRRVTLDLNSRIPTPAETRAFVAVDSPAQWRNKTDDLLAAPAFDRHLAHELNWLLMDGDQTDYQKYLDLAVRERRPWDAIFRETILARADETARPGVDHFLRKRVRETGRMTNDVSVRFFGVNISCAQCHDHPYVEDWTMDTYYGMTAFFGRTFDNGGFLAERDYGLVSYKTGGGGNPKEKIASLRFLGGSPLDEPAQHEPTDAEKKAEKQRLDEFKKNKQAPPPPKYSRRTRLVETGLADSQQHWFARSIVNRIWCQFFGYGLVMPLDQMHGENEPSHPELLHWLARDLVAHGYDLRRLVRGIVLSHAYRRDSAWNSETERRPNPDNFAVAVPRPLTPRQYGIALKFAATDPTRFSEELDPAELARRIESVERSGAGLARWFERPGENFNVAVDEALLLSNSPDVKSQLLDAGLARHLDSLDDPQAMVRQACLSILTRQPTPDEIQILTTYLADRPDRPAQALRQVVWALLTGSESRFNH